MDIELSPVSALRMTIAEVYGVWARVEGGLCGLACHRRVGPEVGIQVIYMSKGPFNGSPMAFSF